MKMDVLLEEIERHDEQHPFTVRSLRYDVSNSDLLVLLQFDLSSNLMELTCIERVGIIVIITMDSLEDGKTVLISIG